MKHLVAAFAFGLVGSSAFAGEGTEIFTDHTTQGLYENCKSESDIRTIACIEYLRAIFDMGDAIKLAGDTKGVSAENRKWIRSFGTCRSEKITPGQLRQVFVLWAERNPKKWQVSESVGALEALTEAWPCPKK